MSLGGDRNTSKNIIWILIHGIMEYYQRILIHTLTNILLCAGIMILHTVVVVWFENWCGCQGVNGLCRCLDGFWTGSSVEKWVADCEHGRRFIRVLQRTLLTLHHSFACVCDPNPGTQRRKRESLQRDARFSYIQLLLTPCPHTLSTPW